MKKTILLFSALMILFTGLQSCNDGNKNAENNETEANVEQNVEQQTQEMTGNQSSRELENTSVVPSGTYTGTAKVVDSQQNEVYLQVNDTTTLELYFSNDTQIMQNGNKVAFSALQQGQRLEVEVQKEGQSLKPRVVRIVQ